MLRLRSRNWLCSFFLLSFSLLFFGKSGMNKYSMYNDVQRLVLKWEKYKLVSILAKIGCTSMSWFTYRHHKECLYNSLFCEKKSLHYILSIPNWGRDLQFGCSKGKKKSFYLFSLIFTSLLNYSNSSGHFLDFLSISNWTET